jgi:hypothetical protein
MARHLPFSSLLRVCAALVAGFVMTLSGCAGEEPSDAERKRCFDQYIREHSAEYPVETLKKTAALKCYS